VSTFRYRARWTAFAFAAIAYCSARAYAPTPKAEAPTGPVRLRCQPPGDVPEVQAAINARANVFLEALAPELSAKGIVATRGSARLTPQLTKSGEATLLDAWRFDFQTLAGKRIGLGYAIGENPLGRNIFYNSTGILNTAANTPILTIRAVESEQHELIGCIVVGSPLSAKFVYDLATGQAIAQDLETSLPATELGQYAATPIADTVPR
jgi:hypothetical protein